MSTQRRRLFLEALRFCARLPAGASKGMDVVEPGAAARYVPVVGLLIGAVGGAVYWLGAQLWPTSIAVVLSMFATAVLPGGTPGNVVSEQRASEATPKPLVPGFGVAGFVFALLLKYNTLMALSAASLPFAVPANVALGLIMICGHAASRALVVSLLASSAPESRMPVSNGDLVLVLALGFAPATLLGIPGLIGLAVALLARVAFGAYFRRNRKVMANGASYAAQQLSEVCFYLGALASWVYV
jgi:adenosylcobinamide-GDP ribazoletransferase